MPISIDKIKNLREISGSGFLDCKKALEENSTLGPWSILTVVNYGLDIF